MHHKLTINSDITIKELESFITKLNELFKNKSIVKVMRVLVERYQSKKLRPLLNYEENILKIIIDLLDTKHTDEFYLSGATNMFDDDYFSSFDAKESMIQLNESNISNLISRDTGLQIRLGSDIIYAKIKCNHYFNSVSLRFGKRYLAHWANEDELQ